MRKRLDEAEAARDAAEEKLASGDATRGTWVAEETAKVNGKVRDAEARAEAAEASAREAIATAERAAAATLDAKLAEAKAVTQAAAN